MYVYILASQYFENLFEKESIENNTNLVPRIREDDPVLRFNIFV